MEDLAKAERTVEAMYNFLISSRIDAEMTAIRLELKHMKIWLISVCLMHDSQGPLSFDSLGSLIIQAEVQNIDVIIGSDDKTTIYIL